MGVLCAASQVATLTTAPSKLIVPVTASSGFLFPAISLRASGDYALRAGLSEGLASSCVGVYRKLSRFAIPATTESSEVVEEQEEDEEMATASCETLCSTTWGLCDTVIGVLGGGQLGRMLCQAASPMGIRVAVLDPLPDCPAGKIAFHHQIGSFKDMQSVREFAKGCGALTVEIEHVDVETLEALARENVDIEPKPFTIRIIQVH